MYIVVRRQRTSDWPRSSRSRISVRLRWQPYVACIQTYTTFNRRFQEWTPVYTFGCLTDTHHGEDTSPFNTFYPHNARGNMRTHSTMCLFLGATAAYRIGWGRTMCLGVVRHLNIYVIVWRGYTGARIGFYLHAAWRKQWTRKRKPRPRQTELDDGLQVLCARGLSGAPTELFTGSAESDLLTIRAYAAAVYRAVSDTAARLSYNKCKCVFFWSPQPPKIAARTPVLAHTY